MGLEPGDFSAGGADRMEVQQAFFNSVVRLLETAEYGGREDLATVI